MSAMRWVSPGGSIINGVATKAQVELLLRLCAERGVTVTLPGLIAPNPEGGTWFPYRVVGAPGPGDIAVAEATVASAYVGKADQAAKVAAMAPAFAGWFAVARSLAERGVNAERISSALDYRPRAGSDPGYVARTMAEKLGFGCFAPSPDLGAKPPLKAEPRRGSADSMASAIDLLRAAGVLPPAPTPTPTPAPAEAVKPVPSGAGPLRGLNRAEARSLVALGATDEALDGLEAAFWVASTVGGRPLTRAEGKALVTLGLSEGVIDALESGFVLTPKS